MNRIARVRAKHDIARRRDRLRDVGEALLGAERRHHLRVGIELHAEAAAVIGRLRLAQPRNAAGGRIAVGAWLAGHFSQLVQHMRRRRQVRVAHAEVDDVGTRIACRELGLVDLLEDVGRQSPNAVELFHGRRSWCGAASHVGAAQRAPFITGFLGCEGSVEGFQRRRPAVRHHWLLFLLFRQPSRPLSWVRRPWPASCLVAWRRLLGGGGGGGGGLARFFCCSRNVTRSVSSFFCSSVLKGLASRVGRVS